MKLCYLQKKWIELEIIMLSKLSEAQKLYIWEEEGEWQEKWGDRRV